jgi:hypothetical protein
MDEGIGILFGIIFYILVGLGIMWYFDISFNTMFWVTVIIGAFILLAAPLPIYIAIAAVALAGDFILYFIWPSMFSWWLVIYAVGILVLKIFADGEFFKLTSTYVK